MNVTKFIAWTSAIILIALVIVAAAANLQVVVEAETFVKEEGGTVEILEGRTGASGNKSIRNWDFPGHALEWNVEIPETAMYKVVIRFNSKEDEGIDLIRDLKIDGQYPAPAFQKIVFTITGGWSKGTNDWKNLTVVDAAGQPVLINLAKGKHVVWMNNINGRIGLDSFGFLGQDEPASVLGAQIVP